MVPYGFIVGLTAVLFGSLWLLVKYPGARRFVPLVGSLFELIKITVDHWRLGRKYSDMAVYGLKSAGLVHALSLEGTELNAAKNRVSEFVGELYYIYQPRTSHLSEEQAKRISAASYMALISHREIFDVVKKLNATENLQVKEATLIAIDILGEFFDLKDKLTLEYFQHLIYGLNKCLLLLRDGGTGKRNLKKVASTLWRVYKITKAYKYLQGRKSLTKEEFYAQVSSTFDTLFRMARG